MVNRDVNRGNFAVNRVNRTFSKEKVLHLPFELRFTRFTAKFPRFTTRFTTVHHGSPRLTTAQHSSPWFGGKHGLPAQSKTTLIKSKYHPHELTPCPSAMLVQQRHLGGNMQSTNIELGTGISSAGIEQVVLKF